MPRDGIELLDGDVRCQRLVHNEDGVISRGEFIALAESLLHKQGMNFSSDIFKQFDANHDNVISRDELIELVLELAL